MFDCEVLSGAIPLLLFGDLNLPGESCAKLLHSVIRGPTCSTDEVADLVRPLTGDNPWLLDAFSLPGGGGAGRTTRIAPTGTGSCPQKCAARWRGAWLLAHACVARTWLIMHCALALPRHPPQPSSLLHFLDTIRVGNGQRTISRGHAPHRGGCCHAAGVQEPHWHAQP